MRPVARTARLLAAAALLLPAACTGGGQRGGGGPAEPTTTAPTSTRAPATSAGPGRAGPVTAAEPCGPERLPDPPAGRPRYRLRVNVDPAAGLVSGDLVVRFTPDRATSRLVFRLWPNGPRQAGAGARLVAGPATEAGQRLASGQPDPTTLVVQPGRALGPGRGILLRLPWRLRLPGPAPDRLARQGSSVRLGSFFPLLAWQPGVGWATDPPTTGFAEASTSPTADVELTVTVPAGLDVLASGMPLGGGRFRATAVRDVGLSVGRFTLARAVAQAPDPVRVTVGVAAGVGERPGPYLARVVRALEDLAGRFGPYPWPTFTLAITPGLPGGIEYPTHVMQGPRTLGRTTSHEVAHQWFYSLVGNNQGRHPWLDEGLASYGEARVEGTLDRFRAWPLPAGVRGRLDAPMRFWDQAADRYYRGVYVQGAQAVAALGRPATVDCALRVYVLRSAWRVAEPADLVCAAAAVLPAAPRVLAGYGVRASPCPAG